MSAITSSTSGIEVNDAINRAGAAGEQYLEAAQEAVSRAAGWVPPAQASAAAAAADAAQVSPFDWTARPGWPSARWMLGLNLAKDALDPRIKYSGGAGKTHWDARGELLVASSGVWAVDCDPATLRRRGRSIWSGRTNQWRFSEDLTNGATGRSGMEPLQPSTDGWFKAAESATNSAHHVNAGFSVTPGQYTFSVDLKAAERTFAILRYDTSSTAIPGNAFQATIDLITGELLGITPGMQNMFRVRKIADGWRISSVVNATATGIIRPIVLIAIGVSNFGYTGDGVSGFFIRRPQFEAGGNVTPYIPTGATATTRTAEHVRMPADGQAGTWLLDIDRDDLPGGTAVALCIGNPNEPFSDGHLYVRQEANGGIVISRTGTDGGGSISYGASQQLRNRIVFALGQDGMAVSVNGGAVRTNSAIRPGGATETTIGAGRWGASSAGAFWDGYIEHLRRAPGWIAPHAQMQAMSAL